MAAAWGTPPRIVALTGGGLSREAGFAPFDADRMPSGLRLEDVVSAEGFGRDPRRVRDFYNQRRRELLAAKPSAVHEALAVLDAVRSRDVLIVTRNIDDLHERAGSQAVIHTHGELLKARCAICRGVSERYDDITDASECPKCGNAGHLRPHVVWVGEEPNLAGIYEALAEGRLLLVIGLPPEREPIRGFIAEARRAGADTVEFNWELSPAAAELFDERHPGRLADTVPQYVKRLITPT